MTEDPELLHAFLERTAARFPERVAIEAVRGSITYDRLNRMANGLAERLRGTVREECVVAIRMARDSHRPYVAQMGILKAGAAYTCIDPSYPEEQARLILEDSGAESVLTEEDSDAIEEADGAPYPPWLSGESLAYVIYTSGTTGAPKGVEIEHRGIANLVGSDLEAFDIRPEDRVAQSSSLAYDSSVEEIWLALAAGATLVIVDDETARLGPDLVPWLRRERITVLCPTPTMLRTMGCADPESALPDLRFLYTGGEALPQDLADVWARGRWLENGYGPTECTVTVVRGRVREGEPVPIGRPVRGNQAHIIDGELCIGGIGLARGYRNLPDLTAEKFPDHPRFGRIFRTGDRVWRDDAGDLFYLGRLDSQVKVRGYRIELEAIESRLVECEGIREAACRVQDGSLVAFLVADDPPDFDVLRRRLRESLPPHMVPGHFGLLEGLPTTVGGKLDRSALPEMEIVREKGEGIPPRNRMERLIEGAFRSALGIRGRLFIQDDFFDLGGDSLAAAGLVSALRADESTASLTVRDVYEGRTIEALAGRAVEIGQEEMDETTVPGHPILVTALQGIWILLEICAGSALMVLVAFGILPFLARSLGLVPFLILLPLMGIVATVAYLPFSVILAAVAKRILIGAYVPGRFPVWSALHLRHWILQQFVRRIPWSFLEGTVFISSALRMLGARIGKRCHIHRGVILTQGGWDLLEIGDDVTLRQDASPRMVELEDGHMVLGEITIGDGCTVDIRAGLSPGSSMGAGSFLGAHAWLPPGERIPEGERWEGIPARPAGEASAPPPIPEDAMALSPAGHGILTILVRFGSGLAGGIPILALAIGLALAYGIDSEGVIRWLFGPSVIISEMGWVVLAFALSVPLGLVLQAICIRCLGPVRPGVLSRWSPGFLRIWSKTGMVRAAGLWLSGTLFWPRWLRMAGMRVGRNCEISSIIDTVPETVEIGKESFFADGIYLGGPAISGGSVEVGRTVLEENTFLGNHAVIPGGISLPRDILLGVCTVADDRVRPGTSWFGHPPFHLPRREETGFDRSVTHDPGMARYVTRLFWEVLRFALPAVPVLIIIGWCKVLATTGSILALAPVVTLGAAGILGVLVLALKWVLLGRVRPGHHPLWSCWCSRWDFLYVAWQFHARRVLSTLEGTLLLPWYLRAMGARIGRRVVLGGGFAQVVDPDMLHLEDGATVAGLFQTHSFEDRVLKIDRVHVRWGSTSGAGAVLFYGCDVGGRSRVAPQSVVMKGERLLPGRTYAGCPVGIYRFSSRTSSMKRRPSAPGM